MMPLKQMLNEKLAEERLKRQKKQDCFLRLCKFYTALKDKDGKVSPSKLKELL